MADFTPYLEALARAERDKADVQRYKRALATPAHAHALGDEHVVITMEQWEVLSDATRRCINLLEK